MPARKFRPSARDLPVSKPLKEVPMTAVGRSEGARFRGYRDIGRIAVISAAALISAFGVAYGLGIRINVSASLPFGFYRIDGAATSNLVEFCPPAPFGEF